MHSIDLDLELQRLVEHRTGGHDRQRLFGHLLLMLRKYFGKKRMPPAALEDLVQDTLIRIFEALDGYEGRGSFLGWVHVIALNQYNGWLRRHIREQNRVVSLAGDDDDDGPAPPTLVLDDPSPEDGSLLDEYRREVRRRVQLLPPRRRACIELYFFQELSYEDIALRLGITVGAVGANLNFAKRQLRREWEEDRIEGSSDRLKNGGP